MGTNNLANAIALASAYHRKQTRWDGITPYILHPIDVMNEVINKYPEDSELAEIAILHDIIEDTEMTMEELTALVSPRVSNAVALLSKTKGQLYEEYIENILSSTDAIKVKIADIVVNSRIETQVGTNKPYKDQGKRWAKYKKTYDLLTEKLNGKRK